MGTNGDLDRYTEAQLHELFHAANTRISEIAGKLVGLPWGDEYMVLMDAVQEQSTLADQLYTMIVIRGAERSVDA
jgi:hypothetical protein